MTCCDLLGRVWFGWAGHFALGKNGISATLARTKVPPPGKFRPTPVDMRVWWTLGGAETPAWNHPFGRILRTLWNTSVPPQSSGQVPFHISENAGVVDFGGSGVSCLKSPWCPESPVFVEQDCSAKKVRGTSVPNQKEIHAAYWRSDRSLRLGITQVSRYSASGRQVSERSLNPLLRSIVDNPHKTVKPITLALETTVPVF